MQMKTALDRVDRGMAGRPEGNELRHELGALREQLVAVRIGLAERIDQARALQREALIREQALAQHREQIALIQAELIAARYAWWDNDRERLKTCIENALGILEREGPDGIGRGRGGDPGVRGTGGEGDDGQ